jgi:hypothetical protein
MYSKKRLLNLAKIPKINVSHIEGNVVKLSMMICFTVLFVIHFQEEIGQYVCIVYLS